ncbi:MAG TPA: bifunctional cobalt-precorrin-7 (C(5))-methyltransferase/cobalt-precorrin-6B (C(15))-methyltransferase, partial [Lachnospiraceae bacterium]|nr:bifunctional cobalt-precorrin-7 (C(5))-methyltransferase/cobalt-precorrin-6B (C(15))-methyltransferase [Lachnospiraceae bacterium]
LHIIEGEAPRVFETLREEGHLPPAPTHVFLGGSGGNLEEILDTVRKMNPEVRIVANAITPETLGAMLMYARSHDGMRADITQIQCARSRQAGKSHLMTGMNPVWIICLGRNEE